MSSEEFVSIVVPTYNRHRFIGKCLEALTEQSHRNVEIIISDDNSTDETAAIVTEFMRSDPRIKLIRSSINSGPAGARNRAIKKACGDYIFFTDDDVVVPRDWIRQVCASLKMPIAWAWKVKFFMCLARTGRAIAIARSGTLPATTS